MIFPDKYVNYSNSYIGIAEMILKTGTELRKAKITIEKLWSKFSKKNNSITFLKFYYALIILLSVGLIVRKEGGDYIEFKV